ncbi:MAG: hypothetical protein A2176_01830 [Spirochaetes bacterium RBG_13_51_14]|nr:MAG: hypothetical protein A2176_01830 [Spirochaetes bacterium RBG_13_51_14]
MSPKENITRIVKNISPHVFRALCLIFILSFLLPYVEVMGCKTKKITSYHGYDLLKGYPAVLYLVVIGIFFAYIVLSFFKKDRSNSFKAFAACWRAISAALSGIIVGFLPGLQFLFDTVFMMIGQLLGLICAAAIFAEGVAVSIRGYIFLRRERGSGGEPVHSGPLRKFHVAVIFVSLAAVPIYFIGLYDEFGLALIYLIFLSLPFVLSQCIVIEGVRRGERWTGRWVAPVSVLLAGMLAVAILSIL